MRTDGRRLLWRCRRGLLELDILLARFVVQHYATLSDYELQAFDALLDHADNDLLDLIVARQESAHPDQQKLLRRIRAATSEISPSA